MILVGIALFLLAILGAPLFAIVAAGALIGFAGSDIDLMVVPMEIFRVSEIPVLIAIPLFTFAGYLLGESRAPERLVRVTNVVLGWMPGGLAVVALFVCALFTAFTGASGVTIIAMGALLYPALAAAGYRDKFSLGLVTTSGSLGLLFAPSLPLILYGIIAQQSVNDLFVAGILPGLLMLLLLSMYCMREGGFVRARVTRESFNRSEVAAALRESIWEIPLPIIVLGGVYSGFFAVSEAAAVTVVYVFIVEVLIYRDIPLRQVPIVMRDSMILVGGILIILGVSLASTNYMIDQQVPMRLFDWVTAHVSSKLSFLILLNLFLLVLGMMLDIFSALVIVVPFDKPIVLLYRAALPFLAILLLAVLIITYWPWLSLVLVR
jgi:tripartite ATP-independent transporter DctM subunit